jgi:3'-phosphoadenosine 5'-phosphosulfate sulfotransferase (PAPS reductase)/FAD synthetase
MRCHHDRCVSQVRELVHSTAQQFGLDLRVYEGSFVKGLQRCMAEMEAETAGATVAETAVDTTVGTAVKQQQRRTGPLAFGFVLGTRRGDPNCGVQTAFTPSSDWMPPFMRVNPILDWEYGQVSLMYCVKLTSHCCCTYALL